MSPVCALYNGLAGHLSGCWVIASGSDGSVCLRLGMSHPTSPETSAMDMLLDMILGGASVLWSATLSCPPWICVEPEDME